MNLLKKNKNRKASNNKVASGSQTHSRLVGEMNENNIRELFAGCGDVVIEKYSFGDEKSNTTVLLTYCEGICDRKQINNTLLPKLEEIYNKTSFKTSTLIEKEKKLPLIPMEKDQNSEKIILHVFDGKALLLFEEIQLVYTIDLAGSSERVPEEPNTEVSIRGPRDGFVENIHVNTALIRKRLKTVSLQVEHFVVGRRSNTKVNLLYINDVIDMRYVEEVRSRLQKIDIDIIVSSTQLEDSLNDSSISLFPLFDYTGRPDYAVQTLIKGRFILITDGSPTVSIAPVNLLLLYKTPEDAHFNFFFVSLARLLRFFGLLIAIFLPGFYISLVSYHQDQIPFLLLATISNSRSGIPLSAGMEIFLILGLYELFREAGVRLPKAVGQTLTVVGGLIIGDAAIRAGLTSPSMVVVASLVAVSRYTLVNQINSGTVTVMSYGILFASTTLGLVGFFISSFAVLLLLANIKSFGLPYLAPISPIKIKDVLSSVIMLPWKFRKKRPDILNTSDSTRQGDNS